MAAGVWYHSRDHYVLLQKNRRFGFIRSFNYFQLPSQKFVLFCFRLTVGRDHFFEQIMGVDVIFITEGDGKSSFLTIARQTTTGPR